MKTMKKRLLSSFLCLCMVLALLPATAFALENETVHSHDGWTAVTMGESHIKLGEVEQTSDTLPAGDYYLDGDIAVPLTIDANAKVNLCLNGHNITASSGNAVTVGYSASLTLYDCADGIAGKIAYIGTNSSKYGIYNQGTLTLHSGAVEGTSRGVYNDGTFTMTGGSVAATDSWGCGVYNSSEIDHKMTSGSVAGSGS